MIFSQKELDAYQRLSRAWRAYLTVYELDVLLFLLDQSVGRGYTSCTFSYSQLLNGNAPFTCGINLSLSTLRRALDGLQEKGVVAAKTTRAGTEYTINLDWKPQMGGKIQVVPAQPVQRVARPGSRAQERRCEQSTNLAKTKTWVRLQKRSATKRARYDHPAED